MSVGTDWVCRDFGFPLEGAVQADTVHLRVSSTSQPKRLETNCPPDLVRDLFGLDVQDVRG